MTTQRSMNGFTVIEKFVLVLIVALFVGVALPYFLNTQDAQSEAIVKRNMMLAQMAAESYARDNGGIYPPSADDPGYGSYFPGGNRNIEHPIAGKYPENPFTNKAQPPFPGNVQNAEKTRAANPTHLGQPGAVYYNPISIKQGDDDEETAANKSYAIQGAGKTGNALVDSELSTTAPRTTLVLTKHDSEAKRGE